MARDSREFERFLRRVHRRFTVLRVLEQIGLGVSGGCVAGLPLVGIALWRGQGAEQLAAGALALGALGGLFHGWATRPSRLRAALEADRQMDSSDLISSAISVGDRDDAWSAALRAAADDWARHASPASVVLNRLGARAWGGIGLSAALLVVLAMLPTYASPTRAADETTSPAGTALARGTLEAAARGRSVRATPAQADPEDANSARGRGEEPAPRSATRESVAAGEPRRGESDRRGNSPSRGSGRSETPTRAGQLPEPVSATDAHGNSPGGRSTGGVGRAQAGARGGGPTRSGDTAGASESAELLAPWTSADWPAAAQRARSAAENGSLPDAYRDVVRAYFDRR